MVFLLHFRTVPLVWYFLLHFRTVPLVWYFLFFILLLRIQTIHTRINVESSIPAQDRAIPIYFSSHMRDRSVVLFTNKIDLYHISEILL
jgi:hypothetical protein